MERANILGIVAMNTKQKIVLWIGIVVFVLIGIYQLLEVPYHRPAVSQFHTLWIIVAVITAGLIVTLKDKRK